MINKVKNQKTRKWKFPSNLTKLNGHIEEYRDQSVTSKAVDILNGKIPKFLYFSHYSRMSGKFSVSKFKQDKKSKALINEGDDVFLKFLSLAGTSVDEITRSGHYEEFKAKLEAASNSITDKIFEYWTQNKNLEIEFDVSEGKSKDSPPFNKGKIMRARVKNTLHRVSVPFDERSAGFIWFFSFLVFFSQIKKEYKDDLIILLDEPGLTLHAKAQNDLLRYIQKRLLPEHQVIYTTHSPFMINPEQFSSVRTVEDVVTKGDDGTDESKGTKVSNDFLRVSPDTVFPLQSALGYEISQTLFIGKNVLLVEGPSDMMYLTTVSNTLREQDKTSLDSKWIICPAGGIDKIAPFTRLFLSNGEDRNIVALTDYSKKDAQKLTQLRDSKLANAVFTISDFCDNDEADIEDMFTPDLYLKIFDKLKLERIDSNKIQSHKKIVPQVERLVKGFSHYLPRKVVAGKPWNLRRKY